MAFILADQRMAGDATTLLAKYQEYLQSLRSQFPPKAFSVATADWYHDVSDHRCPHDAWLEGLNVRESGIGPRTATRSVQLTLRLLGAYHDGHLEFHYTDVTAYRCELVENGAPGHADWRYGESRLSKGGRVLHEIEWWNRDRTGTWLIEAADIDLRWIPFVDSRRGA